MAVQIKAELIDFMGNDDSVANAARVSFAKDAANFTPSQNNRLIQFLAREKHELPFAHTAVTLRINAPIFVARQAYKSKIGFVENEVSRRYISSRPEVFVPNFWRTKPEGGVKQGSGTGKIEANSEFGSGFCVNCGTELVYFGGGGRPKIYCSNHCKFKVTNRNRNPYMTVFANCKARVKREKKWDFNLSFDEMEFPEYCKYTGIKLNYEFGKGSIKDNSPSFDRIDSSLGYEMNNIQIISHKANTMKSSASSDELIKFAKSVLRIHGGYFDVGQSYEQVTSRMVDLYKEMIDAGVAPEQARMILPQGTMTEWIWTGSLLAFARFYNLRSKPDTQKETQDLAHEVGLIVSRLYPVSWDALTSAVVLKSA